AIERLGYVESDSAKTDILWVAIAIVLGILAGMLTVSLGGMPLGLGTSGSILVVGLVLGWLRSRQAVFGAVPEPARRLVGGLGVIVFIAVVGLNAGPHAVHVLQTKGVSYFLSIFFAGMVVTLAGPIIATFVGKYLFRLDPVIVVGALSGAQTCTPALSALR